MSKKQKRLFKITEYGFRKPKGYLIGTENFDAMYTLLQKVGFTHPKFRSTQDGYYYIQVPHYALSNFKEKFPEVREQLQLNKVSFKKLLI